MDYEIRIEDGKYCIKEKLKEYDVPLDRRIFNFVVRIIKYLRGIQKSPINDIAVYQLTKSASSIGANYDEAQGASSKNDFIAKVAIAHREAKESHYWLLLIKASEIDHSDDLNNLIQESFELRNILGSIVGKVRKSR